MTTQPRRGAFPNSCARRYSDALMEIDPATLDANASYRLLTSCVAPRPLALISTLSKAGVSSLGPFSYFNGVSSTPPIVAVAVNPSRGGKKPTCVNIEETREFVVSLGLGEVSYDRIATLPWEASSRVRPKRVAGAPVHLECGLHGIVEIEGGTSLVLGRVLLVAVRDDVVKDLQADPRKIDWVGVVGASSTVRVSDIFERARE